MIRIRQLVTILSFLPLSALGSGSVIGNGGDPLFYFLEATRHSLVETIKIVLTDPMENSKLCQSSNLSSDQTQVCRDFFFEVANQVLTLNQGLRKTLFVLREDPLLVIGPDGKPMPVAARTQLGPSGEIEFHREAIKLMSPIQTLFLIAHEFGHKSSFQGRFVADNEIVGPFATGRDLIDTVAASVVEVARRKGKIGNQYGLRDSFECLILVNGIQFGVRTSSPRLFLAEDLMSYETSLSRNSTDSILFVPETPSTDLVFRVVATEPANCSADAQFDSVRHTVTTIVRQYKSLNVGEAPKEDVLVSQTLVGYNPMCKKTPTEFALVYGNTKFSCRYFGTEGTTSSTLIKNLSTQ